MDRKPQCLMAKRRRGVLRFNNSRELISPSRRIPILAVLFSIFLTISIGTFPAHAQSAAEVKTVQRHLFGYGLRTFDGTFNAETENVIAAYEKDWGLPVTGKISEELILRLTRQHPDTRPRWQRVAGSDCELWNEHPNAQEKITWSGGCKNGKVHGKGELLWTFMLHGEKYKNIYTGDVKGGKLNGMGTAIDRAGNHYKGGWKDDKFHGRGILTQPRGDRYEGDWKNGKMHGRGVKVWFGGDRYDGEWADNLPHGEGIASIAGAKAQKRKFVKGCSAGNPNLAHGRSKISCGF